MIGGVVLSPATKRVTNPLGVPKSTPRPGRFGLVMYGRVLGLITDQPRTPAAVAVALGRGLQTLREVLHRMAHMGEAHVVAWAKPAHGRGLMQAVFAAGPGASVPYPRPLRRKSPPGSTLARCNPRPELMSFCHVLRLLREGCTRQELHDATGVAYMRASLLLASLHAAGLIHRSGWIARDNAAGAGRPSEVFTLGAGKDAKRPPAMTYKERHARYRNRRRDRLQAQRLTHVMAGTAGATLGRNMSTAHGA